MTRPSAFESITPEVVAQATSGDGAALDRILSALSRPFYNLALRMLQNHQDAEDAAQECLIRIATKLSTFRGESRFSTWAWRVATRTILDFREGRARKAELSERAFSLDLADGLDLAAEVESPEDRVYAAQVKLGCGRAMLQCLDGDHRLAYALVDILGLDQAEAAEALDISHAALRKRLSRARQRIRAVLRANCGIIDGANPCRCIRRKDRALQLGRLEPADAIELDVAALQAQVDALEELGAELAFYRADPIATVPERVLPAVRRILRLN